MKKFVASLVELAKILLISSLLIMISVLEYLLPGIFAPRKSIAGQVVVITGSGSGLGRLLATKFGQMGARLVLIDENEASNNETADLVKTNTGAEVMPFTCDLSKRKELYRVSDAIQEKFTEIDLLITNASYFYSNAFSESSDDDINRCIAVNYLANSWAAHAFLPRMIKKNQGHIVTIASAAGIIATNYMTAYAASKHAVVGFHRALDMELDALGATNIKTTLVCPYYIKSEKTEGLRTKFNWLLPIIEPEEAANKIIDAILRNKKFLGFPFFMNICFIMENLLPVNVVTYIARSFGAIRSTNGLLAGKIIEPQLNG